MAAKKIQCGENFIANILEVLAKVLSGEKAVGGAVRSPAPAQLHVQVTRYEEKKRKTSHFFAGSQSVNQVKCKEFRT